MGGECVTEQDGYYVVSALCIGFGILSVVFFLIPTAKKLQGTSRSLPFRHCLILMGARDSGAGEQMEGLHLNRGSDCADSVKVDVSYRIVLATQGTLSSAGYLLCVLWR